MKPNWHMRLFCDELAAVAVDVIAGRPKKHDLIFNVPFGTSKSTVISILFPCWVTAKFPAARFICATHTDSLVMDLATKARDVLESDEYRRLFPEVEIRSDRSSKEDYHNTFGGERKSCTVGGKTPTGRHAHFIIVDDPIDPQGVRSEAELESAARFVNEVIPSRVVDKEVTPTILVMQRLHPRDPTHVMLEAGKRDGAIPVRHICLPGELADGAAEVKPSLDWLREKYGGEVYAEDGLLDPVRLPRRVLAGLFAKLGRFAYAGQVLQNPSMPGGGMFQPQWFNQRVRAAPYDARRVRFWDRAATADGGCYTAGVLLARDSEGKLFVEDVVHGQWEPNERNTRILAVAHRDRARYGPLHEPVIIIEAERGSTGLEAFQALARRLIGFRVREDQPTGSKDVRAEPWADQLAAQNVWLVDDGSWDVQGYVEEHLLFRPDLTVKRLGKFKDRVDASSGALKCLILRTQDVPPLRVYALGAQRKGLLKMVAVSRAGLPMVEMTNRCLIVCFDDVSRCGRNQPSDSLPPETPAPSLSTCVGTLSLPVPDLDPAELQDCWLEEVPGYAKKPEELVMNPTDGKKLWAFLLKRRDPVADVWVFVDDGGGDRRALSVANACADVMRVSRKEGVFAPETLPQVDNKGEGPNRHIFAVVKTSRSQVM